MGRLLKKSVGGGGFYYRVEKKGDVGGVAHPAKWKKVIFSKQRGGGVELT